jgi:hypothetical protein
MNYYNEHDKKAAACCWDGSLIVSRFGLWFDNLQKLFH